MRTAFVQQHCGFVVDSMDALQVGDLKDLNEEVIIFWVSWVIYYGRLMGPVMNGTFRSKYRCTFFKSVGTAVQDIVTADDVIKTAMRLGIGTNVDM